MKVVDMVKAGIIDPAKVTINAIRNAISVAINVITTEALIAEEPSDKEDAAPAMPPMGGMGGMGGMPGMM